MAGLVQPMSLDPNDPNNIRIAEQNSSLYKLWNNIQDFYNIDRNKPWYAPSNLGAYGNLILDASTPFTLGLGLARGGLRVLPKLIGLEAAQQPLGYGLEQGGKYLDPYVLGR